jgi:F-type H+-transporting ATPase subunit gamma
MSNIKLLKRRVKSVSNTKQITKAMELVAASKLKKIQDQTVATKIYCELAYSLLHRIAGSADTNQNPYFKTANSKKSLLVVIASDRGLAGAFLSSLANKAYGYASHRQDGEVDCIVVGRRMATYITRARSINLLGVYDHFDDQPKSEDFRPIVATIKEGIESRKYNNISICYSEFISTTNCKPTTLQLFPIEKTADTSTISDVVFDFEPSPEEILEKAALLYIQSQIFQARLESAASEYALRMMAMHTASENASDLIDEFRLEINTSRQTMITNQMAELSGALAAL